ncbi:DMT family transporter [Amycolatopsis cihanbeyliensis]|uniref:EamA-like transporter family protein n=1 Tax=Amycolatopsis cihanbeyliensis TaxID=1128664 RepID=A0A542CTR4_AMYCI|nr:DMT family transporter [Amycolatopsis cihanbeyliensis]TQI94184.1 EamA-like transporter family protein [Amycolatopsis cihanbeyliensis]
MHGTAVLLVLLAAVGHACWNLVAKRVPGGARFVWLYYTVSAVALAPVVGWFLLFGDEPARPSWLLAAAVTAVLHVVYGVVLQRGYAAGDLSVVYPLARGTGPLLSVLAAVLLLGERPGPLGVAGAALVITGVLVISSGGSGTTSGGRARRAGIGYGLLTGAVIAGYTLWDAYAVTALAVPPFVYFGTGALLQSLLLAPAVAAAPRQVGALWRRHRSEVLLVGLLSPAAYLLVLFAMRMAPVSLVAPMRELSIVLGGLAAWWMLGEANPVRRITGSGVVLAGITALALA